jgi:hypothetical protein
MDSGKSKDTLENETESKENDEKSKVNDRKTKPTFYNSSTNKKEEKKKEKKERVQNQLEKSEHHTFIIDAIKWFYQQEDTMQSPKDLTENYDTMLKLLRHYTPNDIRVAIKSGRDDIFWQKNFRSLNKLGKAKDGEKYIDFFIHLSKIKTREFIEQSDKKIIKGFN